MKPFSLNIQGILHAFDKPQVMGILNITDDSFFDGGIYLNPEDAAKQAIRMAEEGAQFVDIGASSSRPGSSPVSQDVELTRIIPVIHAIKDALPNILISIDTFRAIVAKEAIDQGAHLINDISSGDDDKNMLDVVGQLGVPYIAMHKKGTTQTMQDKPEYEDVTAEVLDYFNEKLVLFSKLGITDSILDPGFGFGKTVRHNYQLLSNLPAISSVCNRPIMVGVSRKSMINKVLKIMAKEALNGTTSANTLAIISGASILRVHDVKEANEAIQISLAFMKESNTTSLNY
jgi:dihydropteroate synthase